MLINRRARRRRRNDALDALKAQLKAIPARDEDGRECLAYELPDGRLASDLEDAERMLNGEEWDEE